MRYLWQNKSVLNVWHTRTSAVYGGKLKLNFSFRTMNLTSTLGPTWKAATNGTVTSGTDQNLTAAVIIGFVAVILAFENYLLLFAVSEKKLRRVPEILIFWLAVSSMMNSFTTVAIIAYHRVADNEGRTGIDSLCKTQFWFATTLRTNDICTTTLMSIDRFFATTKPLLYRSRVRREHGWLSVAMSFIISSIISCLPFLGFGGISRVVPSLCVAKWDSQVSILILVIAFVQFAIVLWCYIAIFWSIKQLVRRQKAMAKSQQITYDSPALNRRKAPSPSISLSPSMDTSSTSLELQNQGHQSEKPIPLRIKAAVNRTLSNYEGAQSQSFGLAGQQEGIFRIGSTTSLSTVSVRSKTSPKGLRPQSSKSQYNGNIPPHLRRMSSLRGGSMPLNQNNSLKPSIFRHLTSFRGRLHDSVMKRRRQAREKRQWKESEHFAKVMGAIVLLFYISWIPLAVSKFGNCEIVHHSSSVND